MQLNLHIFELIIITLGAVFLSFQLGRFIATSRRERDFDRGFEACRKASEETHLEEQALALKSLLQIAQHNAAVIAYYGDIEFEVRCTPMAERELH